MDWIWETRKNQRQLLCFYQSCEWAVLLTLEPKNEEVVVGGKIRNLKFFWNIK